MGIKIQLPLVVISVVLMLAAITLASSAPARAAGPWYVKPGGNDANDCLSPATACATINGALNKPGFVAGDTILVATGTYTGTGAEVVLLNKSATLSGGWNISFTLQSGMSTIDGGGGITASDGATASIERFVVQRGGIYNAGGVLTLTSSTVISSAGGINNQGILILNSSTVSSNTLFGIFNSTALTLNNSTVSGNTTVTGSIGGWGIRNHGIATLNNSTISGNTVFIGGGGGINNDGGSVILNNSAVVNNSAAESAGGGIDNVAGSVILNNTTISGNKADWVGGGIYSSGVLTLNSSTVSGNVAGPYGGGIYNSGENSAVTLRNTILAGNMPFSGPDCSGIIGSAGYNLIGNIAGCEITFNTGDVVNVNPLLFPLIGSLGYHPLLLGSPAIDAGNPDGCRDHLDNLLVTDQRGVLRVGRCDIGAYEANPDNNPLAQVCLPVIARNFCPDFFDNFSNPASGWAVIDDAFVRSEYLNGEFRILSKQTGYFYLFRAPTYSRENYVVEADARWGDTRGSTYGLLFGITSAFDQYYLFHMNTDVGYFQLLRRDPTGFSTLVDFTYSPAINLGAASNHLKVTRHGSQITLEVNGTIVDTLSDGTITGLTGVGLLSNPYLGTPTSDARFDNFSVTCVPGSGAAGLGLSGMTIAASDLHIRQRRIAAPAEPLASRPARAAGPWFVAPSGSDSNSCLNPSIPCVSVNGALNEPGFVVGRRSGWRLGLTPAWAIKWFCSIKCDAIWMEQQ